MNVIVLAAGIFVTVFAVVNMKRILVAGIRVGMHFEITGTILRTVGMIGLTALGGNNVSAGNVCSAV